MVEIPLARQALEVSRLNEHQGLVALAADAINRASKDGRTSTSVVCRNLTESGVEAAKAVADMLKLRGYSVRVARLERDDRLDIIIDWSVPAS